MLFLGEKLKDVTVRNQKTVFSQATGLQIGQNRRVGAEFRRGGIPSWALDAGLGAFKMAARPADIEPAQWLCYYDSASDQRERRWTDEERKLIEEHLLSKPGIVCVELKRLGAPTPAYVKQTTPQGQRKLDQCVRRAVEYVTEEGFDADALVAFERQEQRFVSEAIIAALTALTAAEEPEPLIAA